MKRSPNRDNALGEREHTLVEQARGVILHVAAELAQKHPGQRLEDLVAWGEDGAMAAAQDYRDGDGVSFVTFAWPRIWGAAKNGIKREGQSIPEKLRHAMKEGQIAASAFAEGQRDTFDPFRDTEEDDERRPREALDGFAASYLVGFSMGQPTATPESEHLRAEVRASVDTLKGRDATIVTRYWFEKKGIAEIALELPGAPTEATVRRHFHEAMARLAKRLGKKAAAGVNEAPP